MGVRRKLLLSRRVNYRMRLSQRCVGVCHVSSKLMGHESTNLASAGAQQWWLQSHTMICFKDSEQFSKDISGVHSYGLSVHVCRWALSLTVAKRSKEQDALADVR